MVQLLPVSLHAYRFRLVASRARGRLRHVQVMRWRQYSSTRTVDVQCTPEQVPSALCIQPWCTRRGALSTLCVQRVPALHYEMIRTRSISNHVNKCTKPVQKSASWAAEDSCPVSQPAVTTRTRSYRTTQLSASGDCHAINGRMLTEFVSQGLSRVSVSFSVVIYVY